MVSSPQHSMLEQWNDRGRNVVGAFTPTMSAARMPAWIGSVAPLDAFVSSARGDELTVALIGLLAILAGSALALTFITRVVRLPLRSLEQQVESIAAGDYERDVHAARNDELGRLAAHVNRMRKSVQTAVARLRDESIRDPLTNLFNRRFMEESLALELERAERSGEPLSVLIIDVDHFKRLNDTLGHQTGDEVLTRVADTLRNDLRQGDVACRYGGEEFLVILPGASVAVAFERAQAVRAAIATIVPDDCLTRQQTPARSGPITVSCGVATYPADAHDADALIKRADSALYAAKRAGRNRVASANERSLTGQNRRVRQAPSTAV